MTRPPVLSRREALRTAALAVATGLALAGCGNGPESAASATTTADGTKPDVDLLTDAITGEQTLLTFCLRLRRALPDLAAVLAPIVVGQRAHVRRLTAGLTEPPTHIKPRPVPVPRNQAAALSALHRQVVTAERHRASECLDATSGPLARLLASVSASHAVTLATMRDAR